MMDRLQEQRDGDELMLKRGVKAKEEKRQPEKEPFWAEEQHSISGAELQVEKDCKVEN